jgi:hypothetical protein
VLLPELGSEKEKESTLKIEMKKFVYQGGRGGALLSIPLSGGAPSPVRQDAPGVQ